MITKKEIEEVLGIKNLKYWQIRLFGLLYLIFSPLQILYGILLILIDLLVEKRFFILIKDFILYYYNITFDMMNFNED